MRRLFGVSTTPTPAPDPSLQVIADELVRVRSILEQHMREHVEIPHKVWEEIVVQVQSAASAAAWAAWLTIRRKIWEEVSKWLWRAALGFLGIRLLEYLHTIAGGLSIGNGAL